jgi:hypothetical protein
MKDFVSSHGIALVALGASMSVVSTLFIPSSLPWTRLAWVSLALCAEAFLVQRSTGAISQMLHGLGTGPRLAVASAGAYGSAQGQRQPPIER